jgi:hypothetical protein
MLGMKEARRVFILLTMSCTSLGFEGCGTPAPALQRALEPHGDHCRGGVKWVSTVAALRTAEVPSDLEPSCVLVGGYQSDLDGGGGVFCYQAGASKEDDGGTIIAPATVKPNGRWLRSVDQALSVSWFGARCDGSADDTEAFRRAVRAANQRTAPVLLPPGKVCKITQLDLGRTFDDPVRAKTVGVTFKGFGYVSGNAIPSALLIDPPVKTTSNCSIMNDDPAGPESGGLVMGPNVHHVSFEDLELRAGPNLGDCIVNISAQAGFGDAHSIVFRRVQFKGNGSTLASVFLHRTSWLTFDHCLFSGSVQAIKEDFSTKSSYSTNPVLSDNVFYRANQANSNSLPMVELWDVAGAHIVGNKFENGPWGIYIGQLTGGSLNNNWFNGESEKVASGEWINVGCNGCTIDANHIEGGFHGIRVRGGAGSVTGNYFIGQNGTSEASGVPLQLEASDIIVRSNYFHGGAVEAGGQIDVLVISGTGYEIGANYFGTRPSPSRSRLTSYSLVLQPGTSGSLTHDQTTDWSEHGLVDKSKRWSRTTREKRDLR